MIEAPNGAGGLVYARVIVGTDGSASALRAKPVGDHAAKAFGCPLEVVHVPVGEDSDTFDRTGVQVLPASDPARGLVRYVTVTDPPGLLCLSSRGRSAVGGAVFGSVAAEVLRNLHAPLLTLGPMGSAPGRPWRRLLLCLDGSANAATILPVATAWASYLDLQVHLLHVAYPLGDPRHADLSVTEEDRAAAVQMAIAGEELERAGVAVHWSVEEHTQIAEGISERAERGGADLIALATHGRAGLARLLAGSVALDVIRRAGVPVLTLRPEHLR